MNICKVTGMRIGGTPYSLTDKERRRRTSTSKRSFKLIIKVIAVIFFIAVTINWGM